MDFNERYSPNCSGDYPMELGSSAIVPDDIGNCSEDDKDTESIVYSDMQWSPIPTQSTLNNWNMLTQSLTQNQLDFDLDDEEDLVVRPAQLLTPSPDIFMESPLVSQDVSMEGVSTARMSSETAAAGMISTTYSKVQQHKYNTGLPAEIVTDTQREPSAGPICCETVPETPCASMTSLISLNGNIPTELPIISQHSFEGKPKIPETFSRTQLSVFLDSLDSQLIQNRTNSTKKLEHTEKNVSLIKCQTTSAEAILPKTKLVSSRNPDNASDTTVIVNESVCSKSTTSYSIQTYDHLWYLNTIPETQNGYSGFVEPQHDQKMTIKDSSCLDTIPETPISQIYPQHEPVISEKLNCEESTKLESISHLETIPETQLSDTTQLDREMREQSDDQVFDKSQSDILRKAHPSSVPERCPHRKTIQNGVDDACKDISRHNQVIPEKPTHGVTDPMDNESTFCSLIERCVPKTQSPDDDTFCSTLNKLRKTHQNSVPERSSQRQVIQNEAQDACKDISRHNQVIPEIPTHRVTDTMDNESTFCSLIERCAPKTQSPDDDTFCSTLEKQPSIPVATLLALDLDPTFCSLVEMELQQSQPPSAEQFDFEEAIMRILDIAELPTIAYPENSSGTVECPTSRRTSQLSAPDVRARRLEHQQRIEQIVLRFLMNLAGSDPVYLDVHRLGWDGACTFDTASQTVTLSQDGRQSRCRTRHKIIMLLHLLQVVYNILGSSQLCTQRELYYNEPELTQNVDNISSSLRVVSCMLNTQPWQLGVLSTSKGLIAGPLRVELSNGEILNFESRHRGYAIPNLATNVLRITSTARFILVVEKDTVFNRLLLDHIIGRFRNRCILLTGKGQPDISCRYWLNQLWQHLRLPIRLLCDADPHGIQIQFTYQFGSARLPMCSAQLAVPQCQWLGVRPTEIARLGLTTRALTGQDDRVLRSLMRRPYIADNGLEELLWLQTHRRKASIEALDALASGYLVTYLTERLGMYLD